MSEKLFKGLKVITFCTYYAGPLTTKFFSDYGAEVIKIETSERPDMARLVPPHKEDIRGWNRGGPFNQYNTGKLSVALNLTKCKAVEVAKRFVAWADIVVENFAGGVMGRLGLGYEELKRVNPDIIMLSSCIMGQTGPYTSYPGMGHQLTAFSGFCHITGWPDRPPPWLRAYTDYLVPPLQTFAILAALDYRHRTGKGQHLDFSQFEVGIHFMAPLILDYAVNGRVAGRIGNRYPDAAPHNAYRCIGIERWCAISVFTDEEWGAFCNVIGNPSWINDPRFTTLADRKTNEDELDRLVEGWTIRYSAEEVMTMMQVAGVPAGVVQTGEDLLEYDLQLKHRHSFWELDHPEIGKYYAPGPPFALSKAPCEIQRSPLLAEHSEYALKEIIGMSDEEIAEMTMEGALE